MSSLLAVSNITLQRQKVDDNYMYDKTQRVFKTESTPTIKQKGYGNISCF